MCMTKFSSYWSVFYSSAAIHFYSCQQDKGQQRKTSSATVQIHIWAVSPSCEDGVHNYYVSAWLCTKTLVRSVDANFRALVCLSARFCNRIVPERSNNASQCVLQYILHLVKSVTNRSDTDFTVYRKQPITQDQGWYIQGSLTETFAQNDQAACAGNLAITPLHCIERSNMNGSCEVNMIVYPWEVRPDRRYATKFDRLLYSRKVAVATIIFQTSLLCM